MNGRMDRFNPFILYKNIYDSFFFSQIEIRELINPANC